MTSIGVADEFDGVRDFIRAGLVKESVPSIAVAVARDGKVIWEEGFGWADRERRIPATEHTMYSLASISKPMTSTGLMKLVEAGKIELDKPLNDYLGFAKLQGRAGDAHEATVRRVANHTAGLPMHYQFFYEDEAPVPPSKDETILRYGFLVTQPGERFRYSNIGTGLLSYVVERVSGQRYADFMRREVFMPLGMTRTSVDIGPGLEPFAATRYGADGLPIPFYELDTPGAGGVFSSAHDLIRFAQFHLKTHLRDQRAIISDASIDEMHRPTVKGALTADDGYGVGFFVAREHGYRVVSHGGGMAGVSTQMLIFPDEKLALLALSNGNSSLSGEVCERIAATQLPRWRVERQPTPAPVVSTTPQQVLGEWRGQVSTYERELPVQLRFLPGGEVRATVAEQAEALLKNPRWDGVVFTGEFNARIGTADTERYPYKVELELTLRGGVLNGAANATSPVGGPRVRNSLAHWLELKKD
ncbi:serine hydrolase domain-containing protein [Steroidobacter sp.]|uniref:serine hydrolase domain-containing protein n=1 Tax=Steroidobacter sp. TaxID=1978227 RepID=UPI001A3A0785|nr:serine hydrolase domain-containing protein [Steroidobacter sp.]MBL8270003.1 beta-lactamase family protein [Steroidobacter sp.]